MAKGVDKLKRSLNIIIAVLIILVIGVSAVWFVFFAPKHFDNGQISFDYPKDWVIKEQNNNLTASGAVVQIIAPNSNNNTGIVVLKEKKTNENVTLENFRDTFLGILYAQYAGNGSNKNVSEKQIELSGVKAYERIFKLNMTNIQEIRAVILYKEGYFYVLLLTADQNQFENEKSNFDMVINSFKIQ